MSKVVVVGAGPVGLYSAIRLARQGNDVLIVDRDGGPVDGAWQRRGVMQFRHPHFFRPAVGDVFRDGAPDLWDAVVAAGGIPATPPGAPDFVKGLQCRRATFEQAIREVVAAEPGVTMTQGRAERIEVVDGRAAGVLVDGALIQAELVVVAAGRAGHLGEELRPAAEGGSCGFAYVSRMYRVLTDDDAAELAASGVPIARIYDGYLVLIFPQDARTISVLVVRPSDDEALADLRHQHVFDVAARANPHLARWTHPDRFEPITEVMAGGGLTNTYQGQARVPGLYFVGDAVCTTNPAAGRGVSLGLRQAQELVRLIGAHGAEAAELFEQWCEVNIRPWFEDHVYWDATLLQRWRGAGLDLEARIPSDVVCAAAQIDPEIAPAVFPYMAMMATPAVLDPMQERARAVLRTGWRPPWADGPSRDELVAALDARLTPAR